MKQQPKQRQDIHFVILHQFIGVKHNPVVDGKTGRVGAFNKGFYAADAFRHISLFPYVIQRVQHTAPFSHIRGFFSDITEIIASF